MLSRRAVLAGLMAGAAGSAWAGSPLPRPRPTDFTPGQPPAAQGLIARAKLGGKTGYVVADAATGQVLEAHNPMLPLPPASTAKAITAFYALENLGAGYRFQTRVLVTGPIQGGRLEGDLILLGGGDPVLDSDDLGDLVADLRAAGLREVRGRFLFDAAALPQVQAIDPDQPDHVGYNPSVSGLNLNFNRVYFEWTRANAGWNVVMDARARRYRPAVQSARMRIVNRDTPIYTYARGNGVDDWTVASRALGNEGGRWLPVRDPGAYTAEVFQTIAAAEGIILPRPQRAAPGQVQGAEIARRESPPLTEILRGMLKHSTNLTAETVGMTTSKTLGATPESLRGSASRMQGWLNAGVESSRARFHDHSGLSDRSQVPAADMVRALVLAARDGRLPMLLKEAPMRDDLGRLIKNHPAQIRAKTGTLNFVSALAGYVQQPGKRDLAFAIFSADEPRRAALRPEERERPAGGKSWNTSARVLQGNLISRWVSLYQG
ncbi:D-alanyl-D-alanine carboxypeptidase/D-alanyl-D-alanine-endopeptidase [Actibacterium sp. XHP0104]|nr:D-alanyl-D-alanine carboxypeptidase/D-alanyl-D-alanine-endopeptidase [Actibacterium sp. XHP0104]MCV2881765.1 D-alanyl-D-alanine carboxypeptidase/D-alanyl-D-alanine-endopeptidase [Actibacterium sp. XHP0104]